MRQLVAGAALFVLAAASSVRAQSAGNGFLFGAPDARFSVHVGYARASAGSDIFDQATTDFSLKKSDFSGPSIGGEMAFTLAPQVDLVFQGDYAAISKNSDYRRYFDNNQLPIEQNTAFKRVPLTANVRAYLTPRGREIGKLAWIPSTMVPWVGAGAGMMWYEYRQQGSFIDFSTTPGRVFNDILDSDGWTPTLQGMGGVDFNLSPRLAFTADLRYQWARTSLGPDFQGYTIDLSGVTTALGFTVRL